MALTEAQKRASRNYQRKKRVDNIAAQFFLPKNLYNALKRLAKDRNQQITTTVIELISEGLFSRGYKLKIKQPK